MPFFPFFILLFFNLICGLCWLVAPVAKATCSAISRFTLTTNRMGDRTIKAEKTCLSSVASQRSWSFALEPWQLTSAMFKFRHFLAVLFVLILLTYHTRALVENQDKSADISFGGTVKYPFLASITFLQCTVYVSDVFCYLFVFWLLCFVSYRVAEILNIHSFLVFLFSSVFCRL